MPDAIHSGAPLPVLYSFRRCPYAIRARLALRYAGVVCEIREIVLRNKPAEMLELSPKGTVPVLWLGGGSEAVVIDESLDIMRWALKRNDPDNWLEISSAGVALIEINDGPFKEALDRYKYPQRYADANGLEHRRIGEQFLQKLEASLQANRYLDGDTMTLTDAAIASFVRQFAHVDMDWFRQSPYVALNCWLDEFLKSRLFISVMEKYPVWEAKNRVKLF